jgi:hypothetical protein
MISRGRTLNITTDDITSVVSEDQILGYYLGITRVPCVINSPLRPDRNPSFGLFSLDGKRIYYKDFSTKDWGDTFYLLSQMWKLDMGQTLNKIYEELVIHKKNSNQPNTVIIGEMVKGRISYSKDVDLKVKVREWKQHDIEFWEQFGISLPWLKFSNTYPISHIIVTKNHNTYTINADKYAYVYVEFKDGNPSLKIYQPFSENFKWTNKHDGSVWDLWQQLPKTGEHLIITSSRKDALCIWENSNIPSCSLQAESYLPKEHVVNELKQRFKKVYVLYDNDFDKPINYGDVYAKDLAKQFELIKLKLPDELLIKDTSDLCKRDGRKQVKQTINNLIYTF